MTSSVFYIFVYGYHVAGEACGYWWAGIIIICMVNARMFSPVISA